MNAVTDVFKMIIYVAVERTLIAMSKKVVYKVMSSKLHHSRHIIAQDGIASLK